MTTLVSSDVQDLAERQAAICRLFSTAQRVLILWAISDGERTVSQIAEAIGASLSSTSQHLRRMELTSIVKSRREAQNIYYQLVENEMLRGCRVLTNRPRRELIAGTAQVPAETGG
jgi:ArsR family transcriptional regulator, virulence genes transcriptional regulator